MKWHKNLGFSLIVVIPILCTLLMVLGFVGAGVHEAYVGIQGFLAGGIHTEVRPGLVLLDALDLFMIGFLFYVIAIGFAKLFLPQSILSDLLDRMRPKWLEVSSFKELKIIIWETLLTTIIIIFVGDVFKADGQYTWALLLIPSSVLLVSISIFLLKKAES